MYTGNVQDQKVAFVTGATRGIGFEIARELAKKGYHVYAAFRSSISDLTALDEAIRTYPQRLNKVELLLESDESIVRAVEHVFKKEGKIDVLVNNAITIVDGPVMSSTREQMKQMMDINCCGPMVISQAVADKMRQIDRSLRIVFIGSAVDIAPNPAQGAYSASKAASRILAESLAVELPLLQKASVSIVQLGGASTNALLNAPFGKREFVGKHQIPLFNQKAQEVSKKGLEYGMKPSAVAEKVVEVIENPEPDLRYQIDDFTKELISKFPPSGAGLIKFTTDFLEMCGYVCKKGNINFLRMETAGVFEEEIAEFVTRFYLENHAATKDVFEKLKEKEKRDNFEATFKQAMKVSLGVIADKKGNFYVATDSKTHKIVGFSMGMPYRPSASPLTYAFIEETKAKCPEFFRIFGQTAHLIAQFKTIDDHAFEKVLNGRQVYYLGMTAYADSAIAASLAEEMAKHVFAKESPFSAIYSLSSANHESEMAQLIASQRFDDREFKLDRCGQTEELPNVFIGLISPTEDKTAKEFVRLYREVGE